MPASTAGHGMFSNIFMSRQHNGAAHSASVCSQAVETVAQQTLLPDSAAIFAEAMHARA